MRIGYMSLVLVLILPSWSRADDTGLVAQYSFDEGVGSLAKDGSDNENDGKIHGAVFVKSPRGHALRFDGEDDFIDCGANESLQQLERAATMEMWVRPEALKGGLFNFSSGADWKDQRLVTSFVSRPDHKAELTHVASDGLALKKHYRGYALALPIKDAWNHLVLTFDSATIAFYLDGRLLRVHTPAFARPDLEGIPLWIGRSQGLGAPFFKGLADEVRIYNRALSSEEILDRYKADAATFGKDTSLFELPEVSIEALREPGWIAVNADYELMRPFPKGSSIEVRIMDQDAKTLATEVASVRPQATALNIVLNAAPLQRGTYITRTRVIAVDGRPIGSPVAQPLFWPGQSNKFKGIKILNNLVWELLKIENESIKGTRAYAFKSPKSRWIYVMAVAGAREGDLDLSIDGYEKVISFDQGEKDTKEFMGFLPAGAHQLVIRSSEAARIDTLVVRSIPELISHEFIGQPFIRLDMPPSDFIEQYVMPNVNTFVVASGQLDHPFFRKWQASGGRWRWLASASARVEQNGKPLTADQVYEYLSRTPGFLNPLVHGMIVDEFGGSEPVCASYGDALRKLKTTPEFKDKSMYVYCIGLPGGPAQRLLDAVAEAGGAIAWERYLKTQSNEGVARAFLRQQLVQKARKYRDVGGAGYMECLAVCIGYFTRPGGHLLNSTPSVNYKTYLDMQFNIVANDPVFWGTRGLMGYHSNYNDEETLRWMMRLFRHYGIEGRAEPATGDPYEPGHLQNPDFIDGTEGWTLDPAEAGSIRRVIQRGFGYLQARWSRIEGDTALVTARSAARPNLFSQEIKNLQPGRLYSLRMLTGDHQDMSKQEKHAISIRIENTTVLPERSATDIHGNPGHIGGGYPPYMKPNSAWMNYHWRIFRADGHSAKLLVSDWINDVDPGGPIGQELMYNFISVQPYFSEE